MAIEAITSETSYPLAAETHEIIETEPFVRAATLHDVPALAAIELSAFSDVYGREPDAAKLSEIEDKYRERVELLGDFIRVLDHPSHGVYGMLVCCPTNLGRADFMAEERDFTDNDTVKSIFDPEGRNGYIVNLAVLPGHQGRGDHFKLFADALQIGVELDVQHIYFESRLPGFELWVSSRQKTADASGETLPELRQLAEEYWQLTEVRDGMELPKDRLLRLYSSFGATPLRLVEEAWKPDSSSHGFGVLCEYRMPSATDDSESAADGSYDDDDHDTGSQVETVVAAAELADGMTAVGEEAQSPEERLGFMRRAVEWAKGHKKALAVGTTALAGVVYTVASGGEQRLLEDAKNIEWAGPAYAASMAAYFGGAALMLAGAGLKARNFFRFRREAVDTIARHDNSTTNEALMKTGFWVNAGSAVAAAGVATAAVVESLPPAAWSILTIPLADLYSTLAIRSWLYSKL